MARAALLLVPLLVAIVIAIGLGVGAGEGARAAVVLGAPASGSERRWQIETFEDYLSARETVALRGIARVETASGAQEIPFATNDDGVFELRFSGDPRAMTLTAEDGAVLARGAVRVEDARPAPPPSIEWLAPTKTKGALAIHLAPWGQRLIAGFSNTITIWVEGPAAEIELEAEGEESASIDRGPGKLCPNGMTTLALTPLLQAAGVTVRAKTKGGASGEWFGALPVAPGAMHVSSVDIDKVTSITAPGNAKRAYLELDDDRGRAWAAVVDLAPDAPGARPHARVEIDAAPGFYWLVVSPDPRGAESLSGASIARRARLGPGSLDACEAAARFAETAPAFPRWVALDGLADRRAELVQRRGRGRAIALGGSLAGGALELLLILRAARAARRGLADLEARARGSAKKLGALEIAIGILTTMLGFALLAAIVAYFGR